jgi:dienelactone hydrolase
METIKDSGFVGEFSAPVTPRAERTPAVLLFGGSEGGLHGQLLSALLTLHGYPVLDLAYFAEPGLPPTLADVPLEYFAEAIRWLAKQPQVDPQKIFIVSVSRGSEAALLTALDFPGLVHGVIASVPADSAICSYPGCGRPAWTLRNEPVPYTRQFNNPEPTDDPRARIPVENLHMPVLLDCGGNDEVWHSCAYASAIVSRLDAAHDPYTHRLFSYPDAGHGVGELLPYEPGHNAADANTNLAGATPEANDLAREDLWPHVLAFLSDSP